MSNVLHKRGLPMPLMVSIRMALAAVAALAAVTPAAADLRSTFPGRRIGGGTRGECSARLLAHVVPPSSVFAPDERGTLAILVGEGSADSTLVSVMAPYESTTGSDKPNQERRLMVKNSGLFILRGPQVLRPTQWESHLECGTSTAKEQAKDSTGFQLDFVGQHSPPAISLLLPTSTQSDLQLQASLNRFAESCGRDIPLADLTRAMSLDQEDVASQLPSRVRIYCQ